MKKTCLTLFASALAGLGVPGASFTAGNLAVVRVGDGSASLSTAGTAVFIDEYTTSGSLVQSIAIPSAGTAALVMSGSSTSEGALMRSPNGGFLCFAGYNATLGLPAIPNTSCTNVPRVVATLDFSGSYTLAAATTIKFNGST